MEHETKDLRALFISTLNSGVVYWRMFNFVQSAYRNRTARFYLPFWNKDQTETAPWEYDLAKPELRQRILGELNDHIQKADIVVMQMVHTPDALNLFHSIRGAYRNIPVVVECDDNFVSTSVGNPAHDAYAPGTDYRGLAIEQFRAADAMIVTTPYLRQVYLDFCDEIHVVPNCIDFTVWDKIQKVKKPGIRIGWAGGASHNDDLRSIETDVHRILEKYSDVTFVFVHGIPPFFKGFNRIECVLDFKRIDKYPGFLARQDFDIGLAPLVDDAFNRSKSNLRWLEYSALKIPTIASNMGHFKSTIRNGIDGILTDDFYGAMEELVNDSKKRKAIGRAAYDRIRADFNVDIETEKYAKILSDLAYKGQKPTVTSDYYAHSVLARGIVPIAETTLEAGVEP